MLKTPGKLFVVATPIGDMKDITLRAIEVLKTVDTVVCEEFKPGSTLLRKLGIENKEISLLNEHNEAEAAADLLMRLLDGQNMALISDCGTPVFSDPGAYLIQLASSSGIIVSPVPGASSLMAALSVMDSKLERFVFAGFLNRDPDKRRSELTRYRGYRMPLIVMDTPYRLAAVLEDVTKVFGKNHLITVAFDLTLPTETIYRGEVSKVKGQVGKRKGEFMLIIGQ